MWLDSGTNTQDLIGTSIWRFSITTSRKVPHTFVTHHFGKVLVVFIDLSKSKLVNFSWNLFLEKLISDTLKCKKTRKILFQITLLLAKFVQSRIKSIVAWNCEIESNSNLQVYSRRNFPLVACYSLQKPLINRCKATRY